MSEAGTPDPFASPGPTDDPFANPEPAAEAPTPQPEPTPAPTPEPEPAPQPEPVSPESPGVREPEPAAEPPLVDREGAPVSPGPLQTTEEDAEVVAQETGAAPTAESDRPADAPTPPTAADTGELEQPADHMAGEPQEPQEEPQAAASAPEAPPEPQTEGGGEQPPQEPPAAPPATGEPESAAETGGESNGTTGKSKVRHYVVLMQTGPDAFTVVALDPASQYVETITDGEGEEAKTGNYLAARNNEHAYKLAYHLVGAPQGGATLLPLPKGSWRPRRVAPAPPKPERERLVIQ